MDRLVFAPRGNPRIVGDAFIRPDIHLLQAGDVDDRQTEGLADDVRRCAGALQRAAADGVDAEMLDQGRGGMGLGLAGHAERHVAPALAAAGAFQSVWPWRRNQKGCLVSIVSPKARPPSRDARSSYHPARIARQPASVTA
jgi:hypothetical protein